MNWRSVRRVRRKRIELGDREAAFGIGAAEVSELSGQFLDDMGFDGLVDAGTRLDVARVESNLPGIGRRDYDVTTDEFAPVHVIAERGREQANSIAAIAKDGIRLLKHGDAGPFEIARIDCDIFFFDHHLQPVIEAADHDGAHRSHRRNILAFAFAALEAALDRLGNGNALRQREAHGRVDADTAVGGLLDGGDTGSSDRDFHDHVGCELAEFHGLLDDRLRIAKKARIGLNRKPAVSAVVRVKDRLEQSRTLHGHFANEPPRDFVFGGGREFPNQALNAVPPSVHLLLEDSVDDDGIAGGADRSVLDRVGQLRIEAESFQRHVGVVCVIL